jgi:ATP-dependent helicase HrpA
VLYLEYQKRSFFPIIKQEKPLSGIIKTNFMDMNLNYPESLPISLEKERIVCAVRENRVLVIAGDTGSGKTTQLPKMCLEAGRGREKMIGCTQPRRIAAVSMAQRVAEELKRPDLVGYAVRFRDRTRESTRIKFMTDGLLLAESGRDRNMLRYDTIILDEAHERSLNIDFLLGYLKQLLQKRRNLKLIISSATIDTEKFSAYFDNAPIIRVSGRTFPITLQYSDEFSRPEQENYVDQACGVVHSLCLQPGGDILVFMPTERDILDVVSALANLVDAGRHLILPLFGRLQAADQRKIFQPSKKRKIIVSTNVAETSITVPGIRYVVDTGLARIPKYNIRAKTTSLRVTRISKAAAKQRSGRCGRTGPGTCIRLYSEDDYLNREEFTRPEIQRSNLAEVILQMIALDLGNPRTFPFLDPPAPRAVNDGFRTLRELGAIDSRDQLTARGRIMARLPLDPCIARIILEGAAQGALREITVICAALSIQDPRTRPVDKEKLASEAQQQFIDKRSDFLTLLNIWNCWQKYSGGKFSNARLRKFCTIYYLSWQRMREWFDIHEQITRLLSKLKNFTPNEQPASYAAIHQALTSGFLRNIGRKKEKNIYTVSGGREVTIFPGSCLYNIKNAQWIVAADFVETSRLFARTTAIIDERLLEKLGKKLCKYSYSEPYWAKKPGQVQALERVSLFGLPVVAGRRVNYGRLTAKKAHEAREIFIHQALIAGNLGGQYPFLQHNLAMVEKFTTMEERIRRRNVLADDQVLYEFYAKRIEEVYDRFTLNRLLKKHKNDDFLRMREQDICREMPDSDELYRYPGTLHAGGFELPLEYNFKPGTSKDGVTITLTPHQLSQMSPTTFEWIVPGLLDEKILHLLKRLPKKFRRRLVPLPDAVDRLMDRLDLYNGSLYQALEKALVREFQLSISRSDWQTDALPRHLLMRYQLVDDRGKPIRSSRSFSELLACLQEVEAQNAGYSDRKSQNNLQLPEKKGITTWDFQDLPAKISKKTKTGESRLYFPALSINDRGLIDLGYIDDEQQARQQNRLGLHALYCLQFPGSRKQIVKECKACLVTHSASWLSLGMTGSARQLRKALVQFVMDGLFDTYEGLIPYQSRFNEIIATLQKEGIS